MSVLLETSLGDLVLDLEVKQCALSLATSASLTSVGPTTCRNFLALCKMYKFNFCAFFNGAPAR